MKNEYKFFETNIIVDRIAQLVELLTFNEKGALCRCGFESHCDHKQK